MDNDSLPLLVFVYIIDKDMERAVLNTYLGLKGIANLLGVSPATVSKWRTRYADTDHPCPAPTHWIDDTPGWRDPTEWKAWNIARPGRGTGGGPLPIARARKEFTAILTMVRQTNPGDRPGRTQLRALHRVAETYSVDRQTIVTLANKIADDNPDIPTDECDIIAVATIIRSARTPNTPHPAPENVAEGFSVSTILDEDLRATRERKRTSAHR